MSLPYNLRVIPGVRSLWNGKLYQIGVYPSGKSVMVPYTETHTAEPARMIPVAVEQPRPRKLSAKPQGPKVDRLHVVEVRWRAGEPVHKHEFSPSKENEPMLELLWNAMWISPDCGQTWKVLGPVPCEYHVQYHKDKEGA